MRLSKLGLRKKLVLAFLVVVIAVAAMGAVTLGSVFRLSEIEENVLASNALVDLLDQLRADTFQQMGQVRRYLLTADEKSLAEEKDARLKFTKDMAEARTNIGDHTEFASLLDALQKAHDAWQSDIGDTEIQLARDPATRSKAIDLARSDQASEHGHAFLAATDAVTTPANAWMDDVEAASKTDLRLIKSTTLVGSLLASILAALMGWIMSRSIVSPVVAMTGAMKKLADGDRAVAIPGTERSDELGQMALTVQVFKDAAIAKAQLEGKAEDARRLADGERARSEVERAEAARLQAHVVDSLATGLAKLAQGELVFRIDDRFASEYESLRTDFNAAMAQLQETMTGVSSNTAAIRSGTGEIATAADDLSRRTEQQAASIEETAAALDEITATVRKTAQGAKHAREVVSLAKIDAERSGEVVRNAVQAMSEIEKSSGQISQIIGVIDEIAFQTNLLALNAGVEAARAGEAGRGFAVVASEVRALAQRSAEAAKEIKALISASGRQVGVGVELVGETGHSLARILAQVAEINGVVSEIAASAHEQAAGLDQVNTAVNQMDQVTQQNAAMVEQSTAASHSLSQETENLSQMIAKFDVGHGSAAGSSPHRNARAPGSPMGGRRKTAAVLKTVGTGGAARAANPEPSNDWAEF